MIPFSFHPEAATEFEAAAVFYESRVAGLGKSFAAEVERTVTLVREFPNAGSAVGKLFRRVLVARFPYALVYQVTGEEVHVIAVSHLHRYPGYWRYRTE